MTINNSYKRQKKRNEKKNPGFTLIETNLTNSCRNNLSNLLGEELINLINQEDFYLSKATIDMISNVH